MCSYQHYSEVNNIKIEKKKKHVYYRKVIPTGRLKACKEHKEFLKEAAEEGY